MARSKKAETDEDIVNEAQERFDYAQAYQSTANRHYVADMKFANGDDDNMAQWDDTVSGGRKSSGRPALTVNKTRVHCLQIINDARQNPVQIRINPVGDDATYEASQIYEGIIRHIEYISNAQQAYANATYCQVMGGIGYWRVLRITRTTIRSTRKSTSSALPIRPRSTSILTSNSRTAVMRSGGSCSTRRHATSLRRNTAPATIRTTPT